MKVKITYEDDGSNFSPYWAETIINDRMIRSCGDTIEEARSRQLEKLENLNKREILPPPEEVEI